MFRGIAFRSKRELEALEGRGIWMHDKYKEIITKTGIHRSKLLSKTIDNEKNKDSNFIFISNLGDEVTEEDLNELFAIIGPLKKCALHFDKIGRPVGMANVVFERVKDARIAFNKYKNAKLDGRPIVLELKTNKNSAIQQSQNLFSGIQLDTKSNFNKNQQK